MAARPPRDCLPLNSSASQQWGACPREGERGGAGPRSVAPGGRRGRGAWSANMATSDIRRSLGTPVIFRPSSEARSRRLLSVESSSQKVWAFWGPDWGPGTFPVLSEFSIPSSSTWPCVGARKTSGWDPLSALWGDRTGQGREGGREEGRKAGWRKNLGEFAKIHWEVLKQVFAVVRWDPLAGGWGWPLEDLLLLAILPGRHGRWTRPSLLQWMGSLRCAPIFCCCL